MFDPIFILILVLLGFWAGYYYRAKEINKLNQENNGLRGIPEFQIDTANGIMKIREEEWPYNAEEYLEYHSLTRDGGLITIKYSGLESHLNAFAYHVSTKQKRTVMATLKKVKKGEEVIKVLNWDKN